MDCSTPHCLPLSPKVCSNLGPFIQWYHPTIASSVTPFSSYLQSFPPSGSFPMHQPFASGGQSTGASASVLQMNIHGWFPLGLTGLISLQSKGLSRVFSSITVQKHQFIGAQPSLWSSSHIHTWKQLLWKWKSLNCVWLFATPWTTMSMESSRPEYWSG